MKEFAVVDLFSGAGGMSYGFHMHPAFKIVAAADAEKGKPSTGAGRLQCNSTYSRNIGINPVPLDLSAVAPKHLKSALALADEIPVSVLLTCPPCTGFSRAIPENHVRDDHRNSLVRRSAEFAVALSVDVVFMENARELIRGNFKDHYEWFRKHLEEHGYNVFGKTYVLSRFGLPQLRERAIVVAARQHLPLHTLDSLWDGWRLRDEALTVRRAFSAIPPGADGSGAFPDFSSESVRQRIAAIPKDGGSWMELLDRTDAERLMTDSMKRIAAAKRFGSYPDVYGRMAWDKPAQTIKRECSHVGNGRYAHPEQDRLCTVREIAALQGFPDSFVFNGAALSNMYRHMGDAVPPLISYQLAHLAQWILTGEQPKIEEVLLPGTHLSGKDLVRKGQRELAAIRTDCVAQMNSGSMFNTESFESEFRSKLLTHHCFMGSPLFQESFDSAFIAACIYSGHKVDLAPVGQRFWDVKVDGRRISLKSSKSKSLRAGTLHISKLTEAAWIQDCRTAAKRCEEAHRLFREYCAEVDAIIQLRYFQLKRLYELVEIPAIIFSQVLKAGKTHFSADGPTINIPIGKTPCDFTLKLDRSDAKIAIANINKELCMVHGTWQLFD